MQQDSYRGAHNDFLMHIYGAKRYQEVARVKEMSRRFATGRARIEAPNGIAEVPSSNFGQKQDQKRLSLWLAD